jgi:hypothetical protein
VLRSSARPTLVLLHARALLCLAACTRTAAASEPPTATALALAPTPTNVPLRWLVLMGQHVSLAYPPGWTLTTSPHVDGSRVYTLAPPDAQASLGHTLARILPPEIPPDVRVPSMSIAVTGRVPDSQFSAMLWCLSAASNVQHTSLGGLPVTCAGDAASGRCRGCRFRQMQGMPLQADAGDAASGRCRGCRFRHTNLDRRHCAAQTWTVVTAQHRAYELAAADVHSTTTSQTLDAAVVATFRPDNAIPWQC